MSWIHDHTDELLKEWMKDRCDHISTSAGDSSSLYDSFKDFCEAKKVFVVSQSQFGRAMKRAGFEKNRVGRVFYHGIHLKP